MVPSTISYRSEILVSNGVIQSCLTCPWPVFGVTSSASAETEVPLDLKHLSGSDGIHATSPRNFCPAMQGGKEGGRVDGAETKPPQGLQNARDLLCQMQLGKGETGKGGRGQL